MFFFSFFLFFFFFSFERQIDLLTVKRDSRPIWPTARRVLGGISAPDKEGRSRGLWCREKKRERERERERERDAAQISREAAAVTGDSLEVLFVQICAVLRMAIVAFVAFSA